MDFIVTLQVENCFGKVGFQLLVLRLIILFRHYNDWIEGK